MKDPDPDVELLARVGNNEPAAVKEMVLRKLPRLLALANRMLGDSDESRDVAQETFIRLWKHAAQWRSGQARFDTWLHRVALNLCHDRLRRRKERPLSSFSTGPDCDPLPELVDEAPTPYEQLEAEAQNEQLTAALASLPERQREALVLQYYQGLSNIEAAALMNITVDALESLLSRARRNLRSFLVDTKDPTVLGRDNR